MVAGTRSSKRKQMSVSTVIDSSNEASWVHTPVTRSRKLPRVLVISSTEKTRTRKELSYSNTVASEEVNPRVEAGNICVKKDSRRMQVTKLRKKNSWKSLKTRSSPRQLWLAVCSLSNRQKHIVRQMGFGEVIGFVVNGIPVKLGHYVVDAFNPSTKTLQFGRQKVAVDAELVQQLFGIPRGGVKFSTLTERATLHPKLQLWRNRYIGKDHVSPTLIAEKIKADEYDDVFFFKVDFIMLFVTTMITSTPNGLCKENILKCFTEKTDFGNIDWCDFMVECSSTCKAKWRRDDPSSAFVGPLTLFTLLYVDSISVERMNTRAGVRATHYWSLELLSERQEHEIKSGGFGMGPRKMLTVGIVGQPKDVELELLAAQDTVAELKHVKLVAEKTLRLLSTKYPDDARVVQLRGEYAKILLLGDDPCLAGDTAGAIDDPKPVASDDVGTNTSDDTSDTGGGVDRWLFTKFAPTGRQCVDSDMTVGFEMGGDKATVTNDLLVRSVVLALSAANAPTVTRCDDCDATTGLNARVEQVRVTSDLPMRHVVLAIGAATAPTGVRWSRGNGKVRGTTGCERASRNAVAIDKDDRESPAVASLLALGSVTRSKTKTSISNELNTQHLKCGRPPIWIRKQDASIPSFSLGLTQEYEASAGEGVRVDSSQPSFSLGLTQEFGGSPCAAGEAKHGQAAGQKCASGVTTSSESVLASSDQLSKVLGENASKPIARTGWTKSQVARLPPWRNSDEEINIRNTERETAVWDYLFKHYGETSIAEDTIDPTDHYPYVMFETRHGLRAETPYLQSLAVGERLYDSVIDAWAHVLTYDPSYRFAGVPRRLFLPTTTVVAWMLKLKEDKNGTRVACFKGGVSGAVCAVESKLDLQSFDMVFVPILEYEHYYLVVFDIKSEDICVIDNIVERKSLVEVADNEDYALKTTPYKVKKIFVDYLTLVNHPKADAMSRCVIRRLVLPWATHNNSTDCGVYLMRHMEMYMGVQFAFNCGFNVNGKRKQTQVDALRKRYAANILLSATNIYKNRIWEGALSL